MTGGIFNVPGAWRVGEGKPPSGAFVALVPGALAPLLPLDLPPRLTGFTREQVAGRQLSEALGLAPGRFEMHSFQPRGAGAFGRAVVAEAAEARRWRAAAGRRPVAVLPDYLALPLAEGVWTLAVDGGVVLARLGPADGFAAEPDLALALLADVAPPRAVLRLGQDDAALDAMLDGLGVPVHRDIAALKKAGFAVRPWMQATGGVDLRQSPGAAVDRLAGRLARWRPVAVLAVLALVAWLAALAVETRALRQAADRDAALTRDLVRNHFVPTGPILDIRAQVAAAMAAAAPAAPRAAALPPLQQFQVAAPVLTAPDLALQSVAWRDETGLVATIETADFAGIDRLIAALQDAGFAVDLQDSRARPEGGALARIGLELTP